MIDYRKSFSHSIWTLVILLLILYSTVSADTFKNIVTGQRLQGYATSETIDANTIVNTSEKGPVSLRLYQWNVKYDKLGRKNKIIILTIDQQIGYQIETEAFIESITQAVDQGPFFIIVEIDTPGGNVQYAKQIIAKITQTNNCPIYAFIKGGEYGGAISAGAAVRLACDKIYMAPNTSIGAATMIAVTSKGPGNLEDYFGEDLSEKMSSAWQANLASLAQRRNRPGLLARAMVDKDIEAVEINQDGQRLFVDPVNLQSSQQVLHTWTKQGSLLTLTAEEAVKCNIADKISGSLQEILMDQDSQTAAIEKINLSQKARDEIKRAKKAVQRTLKGLDLKMKQADGKLTRAQAMKILREARNDYQKLLRLAKEYPDLKISTSFLEKQINTIEVEYKNAKMKR